MGKPPVCDFCGRPEKIFLYPNDQRKLELDEDGLWVCNECKTRLIAKPTSYVDEDDSEIDERIRALIGKSAGAICRTLDLPYTPPYQAIIDAASAIAYDEDRYMSAWLFVTQWIDDTTVWQTEDQNARALVFADGTIHIEARS